MDNFQKLEFGILALILAFILALFFYSINITGLSIFRDEINAPYDFISEDQILVDNGNIVINLSNYTLRRFESSGSMLPFLSENSTGVGIKPETEKDIHVGDIITFKQDNKVVVHRVVDKGEDEKGAYFITKGDNNGIKDSKIQFENIDSVIVAVIY